MRTTSTATAHETKERHVTVQPKSYQRTHGSIEAPQIIVAGVHLEKLGFTIGSKVIITEKPEEIVIRLDKTAPQRDPDETPADKARAKRRKQVDRFMDSPLGREKPLTENMITQYLDRQLPTRLEDIVSLLLDGQLPESLISQVYEVLTGKLHSALEHALIDHIYLSLEADKLQQSSQKRQRPIYSVNQFRQNHPDNPFAPSR